MHNKYIVISHWGWPRHRICCAIAVVTVRLDYAHYIILIAAQLWKHCMMMITAQQWKRNARCITTMSAQRNDSGTMKNQKSDDGNVTWTPTRCAGQLIYNNNSNKMRVTTHARALIILISFPFVTWTIHNNHKTDVAVVWWWWWSKVVKSDQKVVKSGKKLVKRGQRW